MQVTHSAFTDAQQTNESNRSAQVYSDLDLFFTRKDTKDVNILKDIQAVKRSVRNLVLMNHYEKPFHPEIGSGVREMLFENIDPITADVLGTKVTEIIETYEPRAELEEVVAIPDFDNNSFKLVVKFTIVNIPTDLQEIEVFLERLR
jgi:phage baseplate assembly protein W